MRPLFRRALLVTVLAALLPAPGQARVEKKRGRAPVAASVQMGAQVAGKTGPVITGEGPLTLEQLERLALERNPTLTQADAVVDIAVGRRKQAGLPPNPTVHYHAEELGVAGTAGQHGPRLEQTFMTAGKLRKARQVRSEEVEQAKAMRAGQEAGVLVNVRSLYFQALGADERIQLRTRLLTIANETLETTRELHNIGLARETELLQAQVEADRARLALNRAEADRARVWQQLGAVVGVVELSTPRPLGGSLEEVPTPLDPALELQRLIEKSPQIELAEVGVARAEALLRRERAERVPNLNLELGPSYDFETGGVVGEVDVGVTLPLVNRNQGNLRAAAAEIRRAQAEVRRVELSLRSQFGPAFQQYETAQRLVEDYRARVLPAAARAYELSLEAYRRGAESFDQVLQMQRTLFQAQDEYVDALQQLQEAVVRIRGFFLEAGLEIVSPPEPAELPEVPVSDSP